jgi:predicted secreted protein
MSKRFICLLFIILISCGLAFAGDIANFVNLGFSDDSDYFMFALYGIYSDTSKPFAELYTVDVRENKFVTAGIKKETFEIAVQPGQDGSGAFYTLLEKSESLSKKYKINHLNKGRLLYLLLNGDTPKTDINFRDFATGNQYSISLVQKARGEGIMVEGAFHIQLTITGSDGEMRAHTIGIPGYYRSGVRDYKIKQVILGPDDLSVVFVIEKNVVSGTEKAQSTSVRYMVETLNTH